jgi:hypothetical protein
MHEGEHVDPAEETLRPPLDLGVQRVTEERGVERHRHHRRRDLAAPAGGRPILLVRVEGVRVSVRAREVADRVVSGRRELLLDVPRNLHADEQARPLDVSSVMRVRGLPLELLSELVHEPRKRGRAGHNGFETVGRS